jgi:DNA-binding SARP family transcriptional activator
METLRIRLLGNFSVECNQRPLPGLESGKVQELFGYLLLHRSQAHSREVLASLLWGDASSAQARKYLRQTLWQLQGVLQAHVPHGEPPVLLADPDQVRLNSEASLWLDVAAFEGACAAARASPGAQLTPSDAQDLEAALALYRGDLLDGRYADWCLFERERLQNLYLGALDRMMIYCETSRNYEEGVRYGGDILQYDRACERTHRRLMRLLFLAGDRTAALRQYARCVAALEEELGVEPAGITVKLHEQIQADCLDGAIMSPRNAPLSAAESAPGRATTLDELLQGFRQVQSQLMTIERQVSEGIRAIEHLVARFR